MVWIARIAWDDRSIDHIARHGVTQEEVEEVVGSSVFITRGRDDTYRAIGQTFGGRYLTVIVAPRGAGTYYVVTARDADPSERRAYLRHRG
jgi:uncharacterized DUF497 family protein